MKRIGILALLAVALAGVSLLGPADAAPPAATSRPASTQPADPEIAADQLIRQLLLEKPTRLVTEPTATAPSIESSLPAVPREIVNPIPMPPGSIIADRTGRLVKDVASGAWTLHFESEKNVLREPPIQLLPNRLLEYMEEVSAGGTRAGVKFRISGEVTEYRGAHFLLLRKVLVEREMGAL